MENSIAVVIPIKYHVKSLYLCLKSISIQTDKPDEVIIVGSESDLESLQKLYKTSKINNLKLIEYEGDKNTARNKGIEIAKSKFILFLDHDMRLEKRVIESLRSELRKFSVIIIPERGVQGGFWTQVKRLEKDLVLYDTDTISPRFFNKEIFKDTVPFSPDLGPLDEWGFSQKLKEMNIKTGLIKPVIYVDEGKISLLNEVKRKFIRGLWMKAFTTVDKDEAIRRVNPLKRGLLFYGTKLNIFAKQPVTFLGLILLKSIHFTALMSGFLVGSLIDANKIGKKDSTQQFYEVHNKLGGKYLENMFLNKKWARYVDGKEKEAVLKNWGLAQQDLSKQSILDIGSGPGRWSAFFLNFNFKKVTAVDFSEEMVEFCKKNLHDKRFSAVVSSMEHLPFPDKTFDKVFCFRAFKYSEEPDQVFAEVVRVLKPEGQFFLEISNVSLQNYLFKIFSRLILMFSPNISLHSKVRYFSEVKLYSPQSIAKINKKGKLHLIKYTPLFVLQSVSLPQNLDRLLYLILQITDAILINLLPSKYFARSWITIFQKD